MLDSTARGAVDASVETDEVGGAFLDMSTEDLEELRKDLADSVAVASAAIAQITTLLAAATADNSRRSARV